MSNTSKFIKVFDANNQKHVEWLSHMCDIAETLSPEKPSQLMTEINKNPLSLKLDTMDVLDWPHIHFCLCAVYAKSVLRGKAWIPSNVAN